MFNFTCDRSLTKTAMTAEMTSHGGVGVAEKVWSAHALLLLLADFRIQVACVQCACVRADVGTGSDDVIAATLRLGG